jgi:hypothetical protein
MSQGFNLNSVTNTETQRDRRLRLRAEERARRLLGEGKTIYT